MKYFVLIVSLISIVLPAFCQKQTDEFSTCIQKMEETELIISEVEQNITHLKYQINSCELHFQSFLQAYPPYLYFAMASWGGAAVLCSFATCLSVAKIIRERMSAAAPFYGVP
ncbi:MAG: hypothetical protein K2X39_01840 [Silvanigrellaceae bacterium]|nr:hypothetical protein [Silvanigrellaceae bacterium]